MNDKLNAFEIEEPMDREIKTVNNNVIDNVVENTTNAGDVIIVSDNNTFVDPIAKRKKEKEKKFVNFKLKPELLDCLITVACKNDMTLTEAIETILNGYVELHDIKPNKKLIDDFKEKNAAKGRRKI